MLVYRVEDQLQRAKTIIENALKRPDLLKKLANSKYDDKELAYGQTLLDKVVELQKKEEKECEKESSFSRSLEIDHKFAFKEYIRHKKIASTTLKANPDLIKALRINDFSPLGVSTWLAQALIFYKNVSYISKYMAEQKVAEAELIQVRAMIEALQDARETQAKMQKTSQEITRQRDQALNELQQWMYKFHSIAQIVLRDDVRSLEALGLELES